MSFLGPRLPWAAMPSGARSQLMRSPMQARALRTSAAMRALPHHGNAPVHVVSDKEDLRNLNETRMERPISPHFTIYQPQLTWLASIANRGTGAGLSVLLYAYAIGYVAAPHVGLGELLSSASLIDFVGHLPTWVKLSVKAPLAAAASFHTFNGFRHLGWDMGYCACGLVT